MEACENCGHQYIPGQSSDMSPDACLNCGHPMRSQPNPLTDDMRVRNIPDHSQDMGGNPLKEGILGDWKNRSVRDESFAASFRSDPPRNLSSDMSHSLDQSIHLPWQYQAAEVEIPAEIEKIAPPGIKNEKAEKIMEEDEQKKQAGLFGDVWNGVKDVGGYAIKHPWQTGLLAGGALLTGGAAIPEEAAGVAAAEGGAAAAGIGGAAADAAGAGGASAGFAGWGAGGEQAAQQAATKAAPGLMSRAMGAMKGGLKTGVPMGIGQDVGRDLGNDVGLGPGGGPAQPAMTMPVRGLQQLGKTADAETPTSHGEIPSDDTSDPEKVDPHEKNDDSGEGYFGENDVNDIGGTTSIHPDGNAAKTFMALLPLVLHHAEGGTGADDPIMHALHEMLEGESPGYMDQPNDGHMHEFITILQGGDKHGNPHNPDEHKEKEAKTAAPFDVQPLTGPSVTPGVGMMGQRPGVQGHCPYCGATSDPTETVCPQCGAQIGGTPGHGTYTAAGPESFMYEGTPGIKPEMTMDQYRHTPHEITPIQNCPNCGDMVRPMNDPTQGGTPICPHCLQPTETMPPHTAAQGPHTPEQMIAVQQYLIQQGRDKEVTNVLTHPDQYARELAEIQKQDVPPEAGMDSGPPEPAQEQAPPGQTMPVPGMDTQQQMLSAIERHGADNIAPKCPECGSHTTGLISNDGTSRCHSCGHSFSADVVGDDSGSSHHEHTALVHHPHGDTPIAPAADQGSALDDRGIQDSSLTWKTLNDEPLQEGKRYYLHTKGVQIPDIVKVERVKPDSLEVSYEGEHGMGFRSEIPRQDAQMYEYTFSSYPGGDEYQPEPDQLANETNSDNSGYEGAPEQSDLSNTHQYINSHTKSGAGMGRPYWREGMGQPEIDRVLGWGDEQVAQGSNPSATGHRMRGMFPPTVTPEIINQALRDWHEYHEDQPQPGALTVPEDIMDIPPANVNYYDHRDLGPEGMSEYYAHHDSRLDWLTEGTKLAGKKFTPMEQREFIDEQGVARNADKLSLEGTHYESRVELDEDDFLFL